ncbi:hypothetical protein BH09PSE3_BH09PSE3_07180 [soil metagenome]
MVVRHGTGCPQTLLILPALFEEANRMRRFTVSLMRALAQRGIGTALPDLPGTAESVTALKDVTLNDWRDAVGSLAETIRDGAGRCLTVAIRGGAMLDAPADFGWRLAPETGERVMRDLVRATALTSGAKASGIDTMARTAPTALAGYTLSPELYEQLASAPLPTNRRRTARLLEDVGLRDVSLRGVRLWRSAEPGDDPKLVESAASDIAEWTAICASL